MQEGVDYKKLKIIGGNKVTYDFSDYKTFNELSKDLYLKKNDNKWCRNETRWI